MTEWRAVPGFEHYEISDDGQVRNARGRVLKPWRVDCDTSVYLKIRLCAGARRKCMFIHRLVLLAFRGDPPDGKPDACHLNHDSLDNRLCNLEWGSRQENMAANYDGDKEERIAVRAERAGLALPNVLLMDVPF